MKALRLLAGALLLGAIITSPVAGQSNELIDSILAAETATVGQAAYLVIVGAGILDGDATPERAYSAAVENGWIDPSVSADAAITFGQYAHMMMQAFETPGGVMYRIIPGPRYAAREFVARNWTRQPLAPGDRISGELLLRITGNFMEQQEASL